MQAEIRYLDCCLSDYFQGSSNETFAIPVDHTSTVAEVIDGIEMEANSIISEWSEDQWSAFDAAMTEYRKDQKMAAIAFDLDECDICDGDYCEHESSYAYFDIAFNV